MALFQRKDINESEKRIFDALWKRYQENPEQFSETQVNALNALNKRLNPEPTSSDVYDPKELVDEMRASDPGERKRVLSDIEREFERRKGPSNKEEFDKLGYQRLKPEKKKPLGFLKNIFKKEEKKPVETTEPPEPTTKEPEEPKSTLTIEDAKYWYNRALEDNAHGGKSFEEWLKSDSDYKHLVEAPTSSTNVSDIIDKDESQKIAKQTSVELEPEVESGWALNISDNPILNSNNYYNVYGKSYTPPQGGIDIFNDPASAYDAWIKELTIRSAPVEKGGLGEIQEGTGTYPFIVGVSPLQYWIEQGVLDFDLPFDEQVELFKKAIESGKLTKELRIREKDKDFDYPEYGTQFANLLTLPDSIDELRRQRGKDWDLFYEVVGEQAETARYFFKLLKAYKKDGSLESARALNEFYEDLVPIAKESGRRTRDFRDAVVYYAKHPDKLVPFYGGYKEAEELGRALFILQAYEATGEMPSEEDMEFLRYIDDKDFSDDPSTTAAKIIDVFGQMVPFAGELKGLNVVGGMVNIFGQKVAKKYVGDAIRGQIKKVLSSKIGKTVIKPTIGTGKIITKTAVLTESGYRVDASKNKRLLHNYQINDDEIIVSDDKVSEEDAERWGRADAYIEYSSEMLGPALRVFGTGAKNLVTKAISKVTKIASKGEKDLIIGQSMASAIRRYIEKAVPGVKIDKKTLNNIRKELQEFGYDGFLEEFGEERAGEVMRAFLYQLTESGIVEGFDNPEYVDNIWTMLSSGEYAKFGEQMLIEFVTLGTPGAVGKLYSIDVRKGKEDDLKSSQPEFVSKVEESNKKAEKAKLEVEEITKKIEEGEVLWTEKQQAKYNENIEIIHNNYTLNTLNELLIEDPALAKELDLSEVNLEEEIIKTAEQLEAEGVSVEGEGMDVDQQIFVARGYTVLANLKLKLGLGKGANYDTVVEEYYGIVRRGGLSKEQEEIYNQHYEKYKTDAKYRKEVNQFINDMAEKMGNPIEVADVNQTLSYDKLFDKEGKSYEYKSNQDKKNHQADSIFQYIKNLFSSVFDSTDKSIQDVYKKVRDRRLKVSAKRAQTTQERRDARRQERKTKAEAKKKHREKKREERKAKVDKKKERREKKREEARAKKKPIKKVTVTGVKPDIFDGRLIRTISEEYTIKEGDAVFVGDDYNGKFNVAQRVVKVEEDGITVMSGKRRNPYKQKLTLNNLFTPKEIYEKEAGLDPVNVIEVDGDKKLQKEYEDKLKKAKKKPLGKGVDPPKKVKKIDEKTKKGKPSYQLTPAQKEFFKDTKVVDSKGNPRVVYHGTDAEIGEFKYGGWFAENPDMASAYSDKYGSYAAGYGTEEVPTMDTGPQVYPVYLNIKKPLDFSKIFDDARQEFTLKDFIDGLELLTNKKVPQSILSDLKERADEFGIIQSGAAYEYTNLFGSAEFLGAPSEIKNWVEKQGFDGLIVPEDFRDGLETTYFAFNPNQIKSATAMAEKPTTDPRISYQLSPTQKKAFKDVHPELLNPDGTPKVFYHGTTAEDFDRFDMTRVGEGSGMRSYGMNFTSNPKVASAYTQEGINPWSKRGPDATGKIYPVHLLGKKMAVYDAKGKHWDEVNFDIGYKWARIFQIQEMHFRGFDDISEWSPELEKAYKNNPYVYKGKSGRGVWEKTDGIIFKNINEISNNKEHLGDTVVMFKPGQIKSATALAEKPDVKDPRISYQLTPTEKPTLFSLALRTAENLPENTTANVYYKRLRDKGVTKVELDWMGLEDFLKNYKPTEVVPKADAIEFIKQNQSEVIDVTLGIPTQIPEGWNFEDMINGRPQYVSDDSEVDYNTTENEYGVLDENTPGGVAKYSEEEYKEFQKKNPNYPPPLPKSLTKIKEPKFEKFTMVGGQDYKELLVRHPDGTYIKNTHWNIPGIIVSLRLTTRFDTEGNKVLFIEEIQSDWTSEAHKLRQKEVNKLINKGMSKKAAEKKVPKDFGYVTRQTMAEYKKEKKKYDAENKRLRKELYDYVMKEIITEKDSEIEVSGIPSVDQRTIEGAVRKAFDSVRDPIIENFRATEMRESPRSISKLEIKQFRKELKIYGISKSDAWKIMRMWREIIKPEPEMPEGMEDTPYKDGWIKLGVKKAILHAVNNNFDKIAVPTHEQIADMFDVSKAISAIRYVPIDPNAKRSDAGYGRFLISVFDKNDEMIGDIPSYNTPEQLEDYLGKGIVDRMLAGEGKSYPGAVIGRQRIETGGLELSGLDLRTPAPFMKKIYDALANTLAKQGRRLGGKSGTTDIDLGDIYAIQEAHIPPDIKTIKGKKMGRVLGQSELMSIPTKKSTIERKSLTLTDKLKDKVRRTGIPSFQLAPKDQPLDLPDETLSQIFIRRYVNSLNRIDQTVGIIGDVDETTNAYLEAKIFPGKVSAELEDFNKSIEDFLKRLVEAGFNAESFGEYLYAKHAEERNKKVHEDDPSFEGTGSGMAREDTTLEDDTVVEGYESILKKYRGTGIVKFAREFTNKVIKKRLRVLRNGGLISQETYDYFTKESPYKFYVPLKGGVDKEVYGQKTKGFSITGKDIQRKRGRNSRALNPFAVAISDYAKAVIRAGQNKVSQKLYLLALDNPSNFWSARGKRYTPRYDKTGEIKFFDPANLGANEVQAVVDGKLKVITIEDKGLLETFKSLGVEETYKAAESVNSWLRKAYTTWNPDFILGNFIRDIQTAMVNIQASAPGKKIGRKVFKDVMSGGPMRAIYRSLRDKGDAKLSANKKKLDSWSKYYEEMRKEGATVGWFTNRKVEDLLKELDKIIKRHQSKNPMFVIRAMGKFADDFNMAIEQATRLSAYKNLREVGYSKAESAKATRDLTVDFNQKGQKGALFRVSYLFSNASMQGTYILASSIYKSKSARRMVMAITMQSFLLNIINSMLMDDPDADDPEDKYPWTDGIPDYEKDSYIIYPLPNGQMFKLQIGWGLNIFHTLGNVMADGVVAISRGRKPKHTNNIKRVVEAFGNAASPIGFGASGLSSFAPTIFGTKPLWEIVDNKKFTGAPIANKWEYTPRPSSRETFPGVNTYTKQVTDWLSEITGGGYRDKKKKIYEKGSIEINPEWIDHILEAWGGGPYRTLRNLYTTGYDLNKYAKIKSIKSLPLIRKVLTEPTAYAVNTKMWNMFNASSYTKFSKIEAEDFYRYIDILIDDANKSKKDAETKDERLEINKRINKYKSNKKSFKKRQKALK